MAVEQLAIGDQVATLSGEARPIRWIGRRAYEGRFIAGNRAVLPIRVMAGALADGVPARDLWLYVDGVLVQSEHLMNGVTIVQSDQVERVEYFHVELDRHDIIVANGALVESYVDCDNRGQFANAAEYDRLYPEDDLPHWAFCLPKLDWGAAELTPIRAALLDRATALGHTLDEDPGLHLVIDGATVHPDAVEGHVYRFSLPAGAKAAWLASRTSIPTEIDAASRDRRWLGVPVATIALSDATLRMEARPDYAALADGFHADEGSHRWTDGMARLPEASLRAFDSGCGVDVQLAGEWLLYRQHSASRAAA